MISFQNITFEQTSDFWFVKTFNFFFKIMANILCNLPDCWYLFSPKSVIIIFLIFVKHVKAFTIYFYFFMFYRVTYNKENEIRSWFRGMDGRGPFLTTFIFLKR